MEGLVIWWVAVTFLGELSDLVHARAEFGTYMAYFDIWNILEFSSLVRRFTGCWC